MESLVTLEYRLGDADAYWVDDFDDGDNSNISDYYSWGSEYSTITEHTGIITFTDPVDTSYADMWIETGVAPGFFTADEYLVTSRQIMNTDYVWSEFYLFADDWVDNDFYSTLKNEWFVSGFTSTTDYEVPGFEIYMDAGWEFSDTFKMDYIQILGDDSHWTSWSTPCTNNYECELGDISTHEYIQYRLTLTAPAGQTPEVAAVKYGEDYQTSGTYTSGVMDAGEEVDWTDMEIESTTPTGTSVSYFTRSGNTGSPDGNWSDWAQVNSPIASPDGRYLQFRIDLATSDASVSPSIDSIILTTADAGGEELVNAGIDLVMRFVLGIMFLVIAYLSIFDEYHTPEFFKKNIQ